MTDVIVFTADEEEPNCMMCDFCSDGIRTDLLGKKHDYCAELCGSEHGWNRYQRSVKMEVEE